MNLPTRQPPRFVPTLTEVVEPLASSLTASDADADVDVDALVATICQQVQPMLARRLQQESEQWLRATLAQHLHEINTRIQSDMVSLVRQAVTNALEAQNRADPAAASADR
jgi:hypothetical protein